MATRVLYKNYYKYLPNYWNKLKELHKDANITPIDYDSSASKVNQENRIKLMLALAREKITKKEEEKV